MFARMSLMIVSSLVLIGLVWMPACSTGSGGGGEDRFVSPVGEWVLEAMEGEALPDPLPRGASRPTLELGQDGRLSGVAGLNRFTGRLDPASWLKGGFEPGPLATTRMAGPPEAMDLEQRFLGLLSRVDSFSLEDGALLLREGGETLLRFVRGGG